MSNCKKCGKKISVSKTGFCISCLNKERAKINNEEKIRKWLETGETGLGLETTIKGAIRNYIYEEQNYKCAICGMKNIWNNKELKFVLDHIDGDCLNNKRENLRLICPNCDSQLDTYKSKNKNSKRVNRRQHTKNKKIITIIINNKEYSINKWSKIIGCSHTTLLRIYHKYGLEKTIEYIKEKYT